MRNLTIKCKLIVITMLTCFAALLLVGTGYILWEWTNLRRIMVRNLSTQAEMIAENCKAALAFEDKQDLLETLQGLHVEPSIVFCCVYNKKNEAFVSYYNQKIEQHVQPPAFKVDGYTFAGGYLTVFKTIVLEKEIIGGVCLQSNLHPLYAMLSRGVCIILSVLLLAFLAAYLISSWLQGIISEPILDLAETAKVVSEQKDYSKRAVSHSQDEVGVLIDTFNEMLEQIQQRDSDLVKAKDDLEKRVRLRTADLTTVNVQLTREIQEREKSEAKQTELLKTLAKTNEELKDFAYIVSHDLKAPLRGISTLADWIKNDYADKFDQDGREQMDLLQARVNRMHCLIEGVLQYSRVGRIKEELVRVNLNELVPEVIDMICPPEHVRITIENELPEIVCEQTRILQVFQNLLSNAVKYMDKEEGRIRIGCVEDNSFWNFNVSDNGPGIAEKYFEKIFQIFQTLSARDEFESTGVGLTVTKKIVELYGGRIWVESVPGQGSTFFFSFPKSSGEVHDEDLQVMASSK